MISDELNKALSILPEGLKRRTVALALEVPGLVWDSYVKWLIASWYSHTLPDRKTLQERVRKYIWQHMADTTDVQSRQHAAHHANRIVALLDGKGTPE